MQHTPISQVDIELYQHVMVLVSIILALSVYHLVYGVAGFVQHPTRYTVSLLHLGWVAWLLLNVITSWWWEFNLSLVPRWNFGLYFFVFVYSTMYFFLSVILFPDDLNGYAGYQDYFLSRRVWFFGFVALTELLGVVDSWIKGVEYLRSLGPEYPARIILYLIFCALAARTRNLAFLYAFLFFALLQEAFFIIRHYSNLT
jgi:hypothetical protein